MTRIGLVMITVIGLCTCGAALGQSWNSQSSSGIVRVNWILQDQDYTIKLTNPADSGVLAWSLEPFNIPTPIAATAPDGWIWSAGSWSSFEIAGNPTKYDVGGPAIEPGESSTFTFKIGASTAPVNKGGPANGLPAFIVHVGAVSGNDGSKWEIRKTAVGNTWYDAPTTSREPVIIPEPQSWLTVFWGIFVLSCLRLKRAGV